MDGYEHRSTQRGLMSDLHHSSSGRHVKKQDHHQTFHTNFPMPEPPKPNLSSAIYTSTDSLYTTNYRHDNSTVNQGYMPTRSGMVFRSTDSTNRALMEIELKKKDSKMRKRAASLIFVLFLVTITILNMIKSQEATMIKNSQSVSEASRASQLENQIEDLQINQVESPPEEEVIEEGNEFLQPFRYFADTNTARRKSDSNFFFHIPRSGGSTIKQIAGKCLGNTLASEVGVRDGHGEDTMLQVVNIDGHKYVNVDTTNIEGLHRSSNLGLASSKLADMMSSSYFEEAGMLFDLEHKGRAMTIFRHPIDRAVSHYYFITRGDKAYLDPSVTIEDYAQGNGIENNWICRFLTGKMEGEITKVHLEQAKEILRRNFLVGFLDDGEESIYRIMKYFDWDFDPDETLRMQQEDCIKDLLKDKTNANEVEYEIPKRGSQANALIKWQTQFDIKLYEYAEKMFDEQTKEFGSKARKKLLRKKKKEAGK